jgi:hypothetical protein
MQDLYNRILLILEDGEEIPLRNGNIYRYIGPTSTRINGQQFPFAFEYEISARNHKKVTVNLVYEMYEHHLLNGVMPIRSEMLPIFPFELCGRPCNFTVALHIVLKLLREDTKNR